MVFEEVYTRLKEKNTEVEDEILIIGIGRNTGSGKTTFSRQLA